MITERGDEHRTKERARGAPWVCALACLIALAPRASALPSFFASDDWIWLYHYGRVAPFRLDVFFSPEVLWFYRPLQNLQFSILYHLFGLNPVPYNAALLAMHLLVCALLYVLVRDLTKRPWLAVAATSIFAVQWTYVDVPLWKSNYNTLQWAALTLAACDMLVRFLGTRERRFRYATHGLCALALLAKESAVSLPFLLLLVWASIELEQEDLLRPLRALRQGVAVLWPSFALLGAYAVAHRVFVRDVLVDAPVSYVLVGPWSALRQCAFVYGHSLVSFVQDPVLLPRFPAVQAIALALYRQPWIPLVACCLVAWRTRDRLLLLFTAWILLAAMPTVFLEDFHQSRYYYLPVVGAAVVAARLAELGWRAAVRLEGVGLVLRLGIVAGLAFATFANLATTVAYLQEHGKSSPRAAEAFHLLRAEAARVPRGGLVVLRNAPDDYFNNEFGFGAPEMVKLALDDASAEAMIEGQHAPAPLLRRVRGISIIHVLDLGEEPMQLVLRGPGAE